MSEESKNLLKSKCKQSDEPYSTDICNEDDHDWWASDSGSSTGSYYSDTGSSVVEWESEIGPTGEVFYIESEEESLLENPATSEDKSESPQPELTRRRSTRAGKLFRLIRRKESKRMSMRNKRINNSAANNTIAQEKGDGSKEVKFQDFQAGEIREVMLWVDPERRHKLGRRATLCEAYFGIIPGVFSDEIRVMVAGFIPDGEAMKNRNVKIGDWLRSINSNNVTFQNLDRILSEIITPSNVTLELQRVAGVDVTAKLPKVNKSKQSILAQYLMNKENSSSFMESLLHYPLGVIYLKTADLLEMGQELQGVLYTFPRSETKNVHSSLCMARGAFITLNHLLPSIVGSQPFSTTIRVGKEEMHIAYISRDDELLLIALPDKCCTSQEIVKITEDIVRTLEFTYQSLTKCFTSVENHSFLDHFFTLIMHRLTSIKDSCKDADVKKNSVKPQNSAENGENYKFRSAFSVASFIQLPRDAQIQIDAALSEMEAMDYRDWNEDPMDCQRLYTILGSCIYHKCHLLGSHLPHEDLIDIHSFLRHNGLLNLVNQEQVKCLVLWKQIYPSSCNRGNIDNNGQLLIPNGKWFLLVVGYGHDLLAVLLESGGCTTKYNDAIGPDVFYVEEAQETLKHIQKVGVTVLAEKWITSNARPEVIPYEEHVTTKASSSITENLFGLIKSSDPQAVPSKQNVSPNKKLQELPSILKKRSPEESPVISGSVYSLQTSEDSLSQGTGGVSEVSDEAMPILGRRATREKINSRFSDDSDSDIDIYKSDSNVLTMDISNIRENLLNQAEYLIPQKLTAGDKNYLYHYVHLDMVEGILLSSIPIQNTQKDNKILVNFNKCVHIIHRLLHNTVRFKMLNQDIDKTVINRSLIAIKEHGVLFEWENTAFWVIGRLYTNPHPKELYVCHQDSAPQNLIEIAFQLHS
ncbi:protein inturned isoform X2 [Monomorium pharaonis]|uniref:protein inturned isoform X1 n=1 Tax=Monomorium pharaonis TaxID=307658 RepID=UPI00063F09F4|nr:protein inturned isoform X1 [Monomorium pharaonis]XP_012537347.1 protein inturned isoform X1 [Monomorium pharaonis]XP_012537348.1 protein inturned isoform X1 [Monomorium pharaonis]XP_036140273.1 protein inturned isoform X2 [Monomorium pharaonis]